MQEQFKKIFLLFLFLSTEFIAFSQDPVYSENLLKRLEEIRNLSNSYAKIPTANETQRKCLSILLHEAKKNSAKLTTQAQQVFSALSTRPVLSGTESTYSTTHYKIHYTTVAGTDQVPLADVSGNGIPDFVDTIAAIVENVYNEEITTLGYSMAPPDGTAGGDSKYDVYIQSIGTGYYGFVTSDSLVVDNPNSPQIETDAWTSYMELNNNYSWVVGETWEAAVKVTVAHEFFHAIQYGMTLDFSTFLAESTAVWMESTVYPAIHDNFQYLASTYRTPDIALDYRDGEIGTTYDGHWYGAWTFWKYGTDRYGNDIIRQIWIRCITEYENQAFDGVFNANGSSYRGVFSDWLVANELMTNNSIYAPYTFANAPVYSAYLKSTYGQGNVKNEGSFTYTGQTINMSSTSPPGNSILMRLSADYFPISSSVNFDVTLNPTTTGNEFQLFLIKSNSGNSNFEVAPATVSGNSFYVSVTDASLYNQFVVVVSRFDTSASSASAQYTLTIGNSIATDITDATSNFNSKIYPNPASKEFNLNYSIQQPSELEVVDLTGKLVYETELQVGNNSVLPMDASPWSPGVYIVIIKNSDGEIGRQRLVISR